MTATPSAILVVAPKLLSFTIYQEQGLINNWSTNTLISRSGAEFWTQPRKQRSSELCKLRLGSALPVRFRTDTWQWTGPALTSEAAGSRWRVLIRTMEQPAPRHRSQQALQYQISGIYSFSRRSSCAPSSVCLWAETKTKMPSRLSGRAGGQATGCCVLEPRRRRNE